MIMELVKAIETLIGSAISLFNIFLNTYNPITAISAVDDVENNRTYVA